MAGGGTGTGVGDAEPPILLSGASRKLDPVAGGLKDRDPKTWSEVSWSSVSLARQERSRREREYNADRESNLGGKRTAGDCGNDSDVDGEGPSKIFSKAVREGVVVVDAASRGTRNLDGLRGDMGKAAEAGQRAFQETEASAMRQHSRKREDKVLAGGAQNFYKSVRVCGTCFQVGAAWFSCICSTASRSFPRFRASGMLT